MIAVALSMFAAIRPANSLGSTSIIHTTRLAHRKHLNRGAARDEASARFSVDKPPPRIVEINQQFARFSAVSKRNDPRATILLGFKPAIHDKAWYETLHSPEIANGGPYMIRLCIDYDFPVN